MKLYHEKISQIASMIAGLYRTRRIQRPVICRHLIKMAFLVGLLNTSGMMMAQAQVIWAGFKAGAQLNLPKIDDIHFRDTVKMNPAPGFNVGGVIFFKVKDRYFLQTEYIYSMKSKVITGKVDPDLNDKTIYHYIELPVLFTRQAKVHLGAGRDFKWYFGAGPNISYLLGGKGVIESGELKENGISSLSYNIKFGHRADRDHNDQIFYPSVNRLQFGINVGTGIIIEPAPKRKIVLDLRYTFDQTVFGNGNADYLIPHDYNDNLRIRNRTLRFSILYLMEYNLSKKERNKGKSNKKL